MTSAPASGLRVVLDTNVYIAALAYPQRPIAEIWRHALRRRYHLLGETRRRRLGIPMFTGEVS